MQKEEAVLITGVFGSGKSSLAAEIADILEKQELPYAALDLDWLAWFHTGSGSVPSVHQMLLTNLTDMVRNYRAVGVRFFVLARSLRNRSELENLRAGIPMPLKVIRLTVPLEEIEHRLGSDVTAARQDDRNEAAAWIASSEDIGIEDLTVENVGPIRRVATDILDWLGWS